VRLFVRLVIYVNSQYFFNQSFNGKRSITEWDPSKAEAVEKAGSKPPKGGKGRHGEKKPKDKREHPDFEDVPGYDGSAFGKDCKC